MAKIVDKIEGYSEMSTEDKLKALESFEFEEPDMSEYRTKEQFDKVSSELSATKKELKAMMSEEQAKKLADKEEREALLEKLAELEKREKIADNKAQFIALGYSSESADATAKALVDGDVTTLFKFMKAHQDSLGKKIKADILAETPRPDNIGSGGATTMTLEDLRKMSPADRSKFALENPEEYQRLHGGN